MLENRVMELESKVTFQDELIEKLNQSLISQQTDIKQLKKTIQHLANQLEDTNQPSVTDAELEPPPPHY